MAPFCENHYLASPDFLKTAFHVITGLATPIHAFGFYCIIYKTPVHMKTVKWLLFNLHFCCIMLDITISFLGIPYIIFPAMAGYGLGPIDSPGLIFYLGVTFVTCEWSSNLGRNETILKHILWLFSVALFLRWSCGCVAIALKSPCGTPLNLVWTSLA